MVQGQALRLVVVGPWAGYRIGWACGWGAHGQVLGLAGVGRVGVHGNAPGLNKGGVGGPQAGSGAREGAQEAQGQAPGLEVGLGLGSMGRLQRVASWAALHLQELKGP